MPAPLLYQHAHLSSVIRTPIPRDTLSLLTRRFQHVFFTPGNHCAWLTAADTERGITHSAAKLRAVLSLCDELHVHTRPAVVAGLTVVPLLSWHHKVGTQTHDIAGVLWLAALPNRVVLAQAIFGKI